MKLKSLSVLVTILLVMGNVFGQNEFTRVNNSGNTFGIGRYERGQYGGSGVTLYVDDESFNDRRKTIYLKESWTEGNLITKTGKLVKNLSFRYDVYNDKIEMRSYVNPDDFKMVTVGEVFYLYVPFLKDKQVKHGYMSLLQDGYAKFLQRKEVKKMPGKGGAYGYKATEVVNTLYYIKLKDQAAVLYNKNIDIFSILPDRHQELKEYIKVHRLKLKKRSDLMKLLAYYNSFYQQENK